jgi:hypothetical protein
LEFYHRHDQSIKSLVELGTKGHFPLFESIWIEEAGKSTRKLTGNEKVKAKRLLMRLAEHRGIERQKIVLHALAEVERDLVVRAFLKLVEGRVLDQRPELQ